ncbi:MAG: PadR family transcriptional regulator [Acidobacteriota bacterium]|jgi:DNA-binding PadR family transcriptional regulator
MTPPRTPATDDPTPLSLPWIYILLALADGARHGYGIMREVEERTDGEVTIWPATLYGAIKRMLAAGLIEESPDRPDEGDDQRRNYYRLTEAGREVLTVETGRLARLLRIAEEKQVAGEPS